MKKRLASLVIGLSVALSLAIPVGAAEMKTPVTEFESVTKEETIIHDVEFLSDATITTEDLGNDTYAIQLRNQEEVVRRILSIMTFLDESRSIGK